MGFAFDPVGPGNIDLYLGARGYLLVEDYLLKIQIAGCPGEVLHFDSFDLDLLHEFLVVCIQRIEGIDQIVLHLVCGGEVHGEQRVEVFPKGFEGLRLLLLVTQEFLRFIEDDDGVVRSYDVDGTAGLELVTHTVDDPAVLAPSIFLQGCGEGLGVDDHHIDSGILREIVQFLKVG